MLVLGLILIAICVLGGLSVRYGVDSREGLQSQEEVWSSLGYTWGDQGQGVTNSAMENDEPALTLPEVPAAPEAARL